MEEEVGGWAGSTAGHSARLGESCECASPSVSKAFIVFVSPVFPVADHKTTPSLSLSLFIVYRAFVHLVLCARALHHLVPMSLKVTGVYFSASSAGPGTGKMKATIRAARQHSNNHHHHQQQQQQQQQSLISSPPVHSSSGRMMTNRDPSPNGRLILGPGNQSHLHSQSQSLDYLHNRHQQPHHPLNFEEKRQIIASSLSLVDFLHRPPVKVKGNKTKTPTPQATNKKKQLTLVPLVFRSLPSF